METNSSRASGGTEGTGQGLQGKPEDSATADRRQPAKWRRVLAAFLERGIRGLNRFEAAREIRDWCLNTTVSQLEARGIRIDRRDETVPGHFGPVTCCRYWLSPEACQRARELLGMATHATVAPAQENALSQAAAHAASTMEARATAT